MDRKTSLSSFLPLLLEEYQHNRQPCIPESPINEPTKVNTSSLASPLNGPSFTSNNKPTPSCNDLHKKPTKFSVVSDNAKIPTTKLRERSGSLQFSDTDDKRELSHSEIEYDGNSDVENRGRETIEGNENEKIHPVLSFLKEPRMKNATMKNQIYRLKEHDRWSAHGSFSSIQGLSTATTSVDQLPKKCMRRPSI